MRDDHTADRLSGVLPFPADHPVAVLGWPAVTGDALSLRPDLEVLVVRDDQYRARATNGGEPGWPAATPAPAPSTSVEAVALEPSHLLVEVVGAGPDELLVTDGTADAIATLARPGLVVWLVAGVGRVLPTPPVRGDGAHAG